MATMKHPFRRVDVNRITALAVGLLCGASLVVGINAVHPLTHQTAAPVIMLAAPSGSDGVVGGRLGGINSADTPNDGQIRAGLSTIIGTYDIPRSDEEIFYRNQWLDNQSFVTGGRLGGIESSDTANDWIIRSGLSGANAIPNPGTAPVVEELQERIESAAAQGNTSGASVTPDPGIPTVTQELHEHINSSGSDVETVPAVGRQPIR